MQRLAFIPYKLDNIHTAAETFWLTAKGYRCFVFSGDLGAGKTTIIHALCDYLQVADDVSSPTYALINEYHFDEDGQDKTIFHMDWYRLRDEDEAIQAGMEDCIQNKNAISLVEWPERAPGLLSTPYLWITIEHLGDDERGLNIEIR